MKKNLISLLLIAASMFSLKAQVLFTENFTSPFTPATAGWNVQNLTGLPGGTPGQNWFQGNAAVFNSYNGGSADYFACNWASSTNSTTPETISNWLITPTLNIANGMVLEFATRTSTNPAFFPDRLEVYYSTAGTGTNVGTTATSLGTFSTLIVSINPNLTTTGYPGAWTIYTATLSGVASPAVGKIGFRYFVTSGGPSSSAINSDFIGLDAVKYSQPCSQPTLAISSSTSAICSGNTVTLTASVTGSVPVSTYTWSNNQNSSSVVVSPTATTIYTVSATSPSGCVGTQTAAISVTLTPNVSVPSYTVCSNPPTTVTLTATGATSYSWNTSATTNSITDTPASTTVYTVTGFGAGGACPGNATATITIGSQLSVSITASSYTVCSGRTVTLTALSAANTFSWSNNATTPSMTIAPTSTSIFSVGVLSGTFPNVCVGGNTISINVIPNPSLSVALSPTNVCSAGSFTVLTSGANTYTYVLSSTSASTTNPISLVAPTVNSLTVTGFTIGGTAPNGCISAGIFTLGVNPNPTVTAAASAPTVCTNQTISLTGTGADTYVWSGAGSGASNPLTYSSSTTGNKSFSLTGTTLAGCTGTAAVSVNVVVCNTNTNTVGLTNVGGYQETTIFPNPFTTEIKINVLDGNVVVYNALGQVVINTAVHSSETINTSDLPKGAYMVKAYNTNGELVKTVKLIKN